GDPPASGAARLWWRMEHRLHELARHSAFVERATRRAVHWSSGHVGWPPRSDVLWELDPLVESPAAFATRWEGVHAVLADMVHEAQRSGAAVLLVLVPLDVQLSAH